MLCCKTAVPFPVDGYTAQFIWWKKRKTARNYLEKLSESDYTGKRILLVEDNELNREIAGEILQMTGAKVETAKMEKSQLRKWRLPRKIRMILFLWISKCLL